MLGTGGGPGDPAFRAQYGQWFFFSSIRFLFLLFCQVPLLYIHRCSLPVVAVCRLFVFVALLCVLVRQEGHIPDGRVCAIAIPFQRCWLAVAGSHNSSWPPPHANTQLPRTYTHLDPLRCFVYLHA